MERGNGKSVNMGSAKRRTWRKLHLAVDEGSGEILAAVASTNDWGDSEILPDLLEQVDEDIEQVSCDGAYDASGCYDTHRARSQACHPPAQECRNLAA
jgi:Transposase DDE domain